MLFKIPMHVNTDLYQENFDIVSNIWREHHYLLSREYSFVE